MTSPPTPAPSLPTLRVRSGPTRLRRRLRRRPGRLRPVRRAGIEATGLEKQRRKAGGRAARRARGCPAMDAKSSPSSSLSSTVAARPVKGILKNPSSISGLSLGLDMGLPSPPRSGSAHRERDREAPKDGEAAEKRARPLETRPSVEGKKSAKWDEMNILATYHPAGKDYGLMKIDEPSTPYHSLVIDEEGEAHSEEEQETPTADLLARKLAAAEGKGPRALAQQEESSDEGEDETDLTPEEREKKRQFEMKRKMHYNEGQNIKLARQLIAKELRGGGANEVEDEDEEDDDEDEEMQDTTDLGGMSPDLARPL
nr:PREDICTED: protein phosphatase inhibitor 2 isoform X3 [Anolis carolinensis]|eukprot:XP_016854797.1 PREDICTED: protein phosphatase inhibitor 2 isoform X3 [Anolis carolinensis]